MDNLIMQLVVASLMVGAAVAIVLAYRHYLAVNSDRRMLAMLGAAGVDLSIGGREDLPDVITEARRRCRGCHCEAYCERWLRGDESGENSFCPNARVFDRLAG